MWLYPWLTWFSIVAIVCVIGSMALVNDEATRSYLVPSLISVAVVLAAAFHQGAAGARPRAGGGRAGGRRKAAAGA